MTKLTEEEEWKNNSISIHCSLKKYQQQQQTPKPHRLIIGSKLPKVIGTYSGGAAFHLGNHPVQSDQLGSLPSCLNLLFFPSIQHCLYQRELLCYGAFVVKRHNSQAGVPSGPVQLATPPRCSCHSTTAELFTPNCPSTTTSWLATVVRISLSQTHRSRGFYSSRHLNEMNLYIPDSSPNLNYCGNKPWVH